jgi:dihydrolipoamide dehydrogenase
MKHQCNVLVIGGGPAGTPAAMALAAMGKQVILVEAGSGLGGTCLFEGCIPSKILRESARRLREIRAATDFGLCLPSLDVGINWSDIMQRKQAILQKRSQAALHKAAQLPGLQIKSGHAALLSAHQAELRLPGGEVETIDFEQAIIATGSKSNYPPIHGIHHPRVLDSEAILSIDHIPKKLLVIGAGPIGVELGQVFNTFGSAVKMLELAPHILGVVDADLSKRLHARMLEQGIAIETGISNLNITHTGDGVIVYYDDEAGEAQHSYADYVLQVTGRSARVEGIGLENTAIEFDHHGIRVNETLQTAEANIYAAGDVLGHPMFAHWATAQSLAVARHIKGLPVQFPVAETNTAVIFSAPEIGIAGLTERQAQQRGIDFAVASYDFKQDARAQIHGDAEGLLKIIYETQSHKVIGVHVMAPGAAELMGEAALLLRAGLPLEVIAGAIHPHPTLTESFAVAVRNALARLPKKS